MLWSNTISEQDYFIYISFQDLYPNCNLYSEVVQNKNRKVTEMQYIKKAPTFL
ncbi:hypothetical protein EAVNNN508_01950 [Elizabethkingia anophelis]|uniref:Uncharacterized protein n=2 Tax=Weeksellaceae TaxID=2762318 RepID=A0A7Z7PZX3_9FLAO|nr:hypothetical protein EAVNVB490_02547 [Elizabethkingia anophelis]CAI9671596.1 hypothetical protein EAVNNN508_02685 [Elizabethkingia anophelis]CAI9674569.1 hypothetical protein EAVNVB490_01953 [Elizabethkingia anophelis]CAI9682224.1 hypothetical protein EAVNNN508_01950 [Elizabethkingia anophelis]STD03751.1 Uncharacterised protein [Elizabethkingia anophelis]